MRIAVSGATGLIGARLTEQLREDGHDVLRLVRSTPDLGDARFDPLRGELDADAVRACDAVIHLAGAGIGDKRWTAARKDELWRSRVDGARLLAHAVADGSPTIFLCGSAVGFYGDRGDEVLTEESGPGDGFLADLCQAWEGACAPAADAGARVVHLRSGIVLAPSGGALGRQLPLFRFGLGGPLAGGRQWTSWISLDDEVRAIRWALEHEIAGPVNLTAPGAVTNRDFTKALATVLRRPAVLPVPRFALRLVLGEMSDDILASIRAEPTKLVASGFEFEHPDVESALRHVLAS